MLLRKRKFRLSDETDETQNENESSKQQLNKSNGQSDFNGDDTNNLQTDVNDLKRKKSKQQSNNDNVSEDDNIHSQDYVNDVKRKISKQQSNDESNGEGSEDDSDRSQDDLNDVQRVKCDFCSKTYSKISNLNTHIKIKHNGRRFICKYCKEEQTTKDSHIRHLNRKHTGKSIDDISENEFFINERVEMTNSAKNALIKRLTSQVNLQKTVITDLKNILRMFAMASMGLTANETGRMMTTDEQKSVNDENEDDDNLSSNATYSITNTLTDNNRFILKLKKK